MHPDWDLDALPDGFVVCDRAGTIELANARAERMFGYARGELVGASIETLFPEGIRPQQRDYRARRRDGSELAVEVSLAPSERTIAATIRDASWLAWAVDSAQDAVAIYGDDGRALAANGAMRRLFGDAVVGRSFDEVLRGAIDAFEGGDDLVQRWTAYHRDPRGAFDVVTRSGRHLRTIARAESGRGTISRITDVTDEVLRADELRHAREAAEAAEAASAAKSEFLSSMSHELRTPLNAILGFAQLLERDRKHPLDERQLERLGYVLRGGEHLLKLIDDVLDLARIETGRIAVSTEPVAVSDVLAGIAKALEPLAARAGIELSVAATTGRVLADRTRLAQIVMNFGANAIKYGKPNGRVTFAVEPKSWALRIVVADDGIGIPADKQARLFEPFQRAGQESGPIEGTGIGLTVSKRLAEMMRGRVGFTSEVGVGSEFWVELPRERIATTELPVFRTRRHTIIYIEDNADSIALIREVVAQLEGVDLVTAPTAERGLELVRECRPSVVLMDINLPGMNGFEAATQLRASPETRDLPIVGLSAATLVRDAARADAAGFTRYLAKPVQLAELLTLLDELLTG